MAEFLPIHGGAHQCRGTTPRNSRSVLPRLVAVLRTRPDVGRSRARLLLTRLRRRLLQRSFAAQILASARTCCLRCGVSPRGSPNDITKDQFPTRTLIRSPLRKASSPIPETGSHSSPTSFSVFLNSSYSCRVVGSSERVRLPAPIPNAQLVAFGALALTGRALRTMVDEPKTDLISSILRREHTSLAGGEA